MLIIPVKEGENIDRALKRFQRKFDKTGTLKQLRKTAVCEAICEEEQKFKKRSTYKVFEIKKISNEFQIE